MVVKIAEVAAEVEEKAKAKARRIEHDATIATVGDIVMRSFVGVLRLIGRLCPCLHRLLWVAFFLRLISNLTDCFPQSRPSIPNRQRRRNRSRAQQNEREEAAHNPASTNVQHLSEQLIAAVQQHNPAYAHNNLCARVLTKPIPAITPHLRTWWPS